MLFNVTFFIGERGCANLVEADDAETAKEYFIREHLDGDETRLVGMREISCIDRPDKPYHKVPDGWKYSRGAKR